MDIRVTGPFVYFTIPVLGGIRITQTTVSSLIVTILLCWAFVYFGKGVQMRPGGKQVLAEKGVMMLHNMVVETMGAHNANWTPFIGTLFLSSICGSYIGLTGFLRSATADISCVMVWALMVSVIIWYNGIKHSGFVGWLKGFTEPIAVMTPMNIVGEIAQPVSMAFRHFGNIAGGGVITSILYAALSGASAAVINLIAANGWLVSIMLLLVGVGLYFLRRRKVFLVLSVVSTALGLCGILQVSGLLPGLPILTYGIPAVLSCYFDLFSGFVQAYVFCLLTMVYIAGSLPGPEEAEKASLG